MRFVVCIALSLFVLLLCTPVHSDDWPQWGGADCRNIVSPETNLPQTFTPGRSGPSGRGIDIETTENVRWVARLGSNAYGNPTIADGRVYVGTDDLLVGEDPRFERSRGGAVCCFDEQSGELIWRLPTPQRMTYPKDAHYKFQHLGVCSSPTVDGDRIYVVENGARVICLDVNGQSNGNDGPYMDDAQFMVGERGSPVELNESDADVVWVCDLIDDIGIYPHDTVSNSVLVHGDLIYLSSSNGVDTPHEKALAPDAPAFIALDKHTGRLAAYEYLGLSKTLYHAAWCSPSCGRVGDRDLIFFGGGDGVCYAFAAMEKAEAEPVPMELVWSYDCLPDHYKYRENGELIPYYEGDKRKNYSTNENDGLFVGPSQLIATPVFLNDRVYVAIGQDPEHGRGRGMLHCIDATLEGDITETGCIWTYDGLDRTMGTVSISNGLVYAGDIAGRLHCVDMETGEAYWVYETNAQMWGGALVADGKLYLGTKNDFHILAEGRELKSLAKIRLGAPVYTTPVAANGAVYIASQRYMWVVAKPEE
jgi:outer membrane protein assembly factor BamB